MALLFVWLGQALGGIAAWFAAYFSQKVALALAAAVVFTSLWVALALGIKTAIDSLASAALGVPTFLLIGIDMLPSSLPAYISAALVADAALKTYEYSRQVMGLKVGAGF